MPAAVLARAGWQIFNVALAEKCLGLQLTAAVSPASFGMFQVVPASCMWQTQAFGFRYETGWRKEEKMGGQNCKLHSLSVAPNLDWRAARRAARACWPCEV